MNQGHRIFWSVALLGCLVCFTHVATLVPCLMPEGTTSERWWAAFPGPAGEGVWMPSLGLARAGSRQGFGGRSGEPEKLAQDWTLLLASTLGCEGPAGLLWLQNPKV